MEESFAMNPLLENTPPFHQSLQSSVPIRFYYVILEDNHSQQKPSLCAESSWSLMCFKFVSAFYGGLQPLMQMCNGSCKSALQGGKTSGA